MNHIYKKTNVIKTYMLLLIEAVTLALSLTAAVFTRYGWMSADGNGEIYIIFGIMEAGLIFLYSTITDWNRDFFIRGYFREAMAVMKCLGSTSAFSALFMYILLKDRPMSRTVFFIYLPLVMVLTYMFHLIFKEYMLKYYRKGVGSDKLMIVTTSDRAEKVIDKIKHSKEWNYEVTSVVIMDKDMKGSTIGKVPVIAGADDMISEATKNIVDRVFISLPSDVPIKDIRNTIYEFENMGVVCHYDVGLEDLKLAGQEAGSFAGYAVLSFSLQNLDYRRLMIKRLMDILGSIVGMLITIIMFPFVAIAIRLESKGPVIFKQERIGRNGRHFKMYKFRSMYVDAEDKLSDLKDKNEVKGLMFKMDDDPRITKVGRFIRKTSIDEFPQFFNIFKGDMSMVGTRPPTVDEYEQYNAHYRRRLALTPGLTGLWQVSGRSDITDFDEVVKLDLEYIDNWSLSLDLKILLKTIGAVFTGRGSK